MIRTILHRWPLLVIHLGIVALMLPGLVQRTGLHFLPYIAVYVTCLLATYLLAQRIKAPTLRFDPPKLGLNVLAYGTPLLTAFLAVVHWSTLGHVPLIEAFGEQDDLVVMALRREANNVPTWINYSGHIVLKGLLPFATVVLWYGNRRAFWATTLVGLAYSMSLLQKSPVVTPFVPLWVSFALFRKWRSFAVLSVGMAGLLAFLMLVANPQLNEEGPRMHQDGEHYGLVTRVFMSFGSRIFLTPGWTLAAWFSHVPEDIPFQEGAAIRPLALIQGMPYRDLCRDIYDLEYPQYAILGTKGTLPSASFMYGWANFGTMGLAGSGVIMGLWLTLVSAFFSGRWRWACCLSVFPLLACSATALPTVLLTHGWVLTLLLFVLFVPKGKEVG